jgi:hypothetical protein
VGHRCEGNRGNEQAVFEAVNPTGLGGVSDLSIYAGVAYAAREGTRGCTKFLFSIFFYLAGLATRSYDYMATTVFVMVRRHL